MANKKNKQSADPGNTPVPPSFEKKPSIISAQSFALNNKPVSTRVHALILACIVAIAWLCLKPCLDNQFTDWDDAGYIVNNPIVKDISRAGIKAILTTPVMGNYHPITVLSYAIEYSYVELEPWLFHFDSLLLHLLVTILVYCFVNVLTRRPVAAIVTALLFALHPMHVESVAWVAGRKDVWCALFYVAACICYVYYLRSADKKWIWYVAVILAFLCALLSKPVAVTLPLVLLLIDYFEQRTWKNTLLLEKIPHFVLALVFGIISVKIQHGGGAMAAQKVHFNFLERIALGGYALTTYLWKAILPVNLHAFYPYPEKVGGSLPFVYYAFPVAAIAFVFVLWKYARRNKIILFGLSFFFVNIFLLLQFIPVGEAIVSERYSYIPYIGLFFIAGWMVSACIDQGIKKEVRYVVILLTAVYIGCCGYASSQRCKAWYDAMSLWSDEIEKEPAHAPLAYNNLGFIYFNKKNAATDPGEKQVYFDSALYLLNQAVTLNPALMNAYQGLGMLYYMKGDFNASAYAFRAALHITPSADNYSDYANLLLQFGKNDSALWAYSNAITVSPELLIGYINRGRLLKTLNRCDEAMGDINKAIQINGTVGELYYLRSYCYNQKGDNTQALQDIEKAISLGYQQVDTGFYNRLKNNSK